MMLKIFLKKNKPKFKILLLITVICTYISCNAQSGSSSPSLKYNLFEYKLNSDQKVFLKDTIFNFINNENPSYFLELQSITSDVEYSCKNDTLSSLRIDEIKRYLMQLGLPEKKISRHPKDDPELLKEYRKYVKAEVNFHFYRSKRQ